MAIDLEQFHQVFFEESLEGLDLMEQALLGIQGSDTDSETINSIFRAAHSIKGGSGTFGFSEITDFTHVMETLLDEARDGKRRLDDTTVELLLKSCDCLRSMINALQTGQTIQTADSLPLIAAFERLLGHGSDAGDKSTPPSSTETATSASDHDQILMASFDEMLGGAATPAKETPATDTDNSTGCWKIRFIPEPQILMTGNEPARIFRELAGLGQLTVEADTSKLPDFEHLTVDECFLSWTLWLRGPASREDIAEVFDWVIDECELTIEAEASSPAATTSEKPDITQQPAGAAKAAPEPSPAAKEHPPEEDRAQPGKEAEEKPSAGTGAALSNGSIRVGIDKVDNLINLVGELVITQSMLSELGNNFDMNKLDRLASGLEQLLQNTKELQESVMRIRMLPISFAFNRFPRMIRDLAQKTGKKVELKLSGEQTELDKTVMERIGDPLVHLVRNAIDHGIEPAAERIANGKPETGVIQLDACHKGGNIVITISDDGRGLNAEKILKKAREKNIVDANETLAESKIFELIFQPGFSTADTVSDISGRGVGMDVVLRNIKSLGGRIEVESTAGKGSTFRVHLPLTLAILDGQLVRVGDQIYIIPLITIVESLQIKSELVNKVSGNMVVYRLREDNVPIIPIYQEFGIAADNTDLDNALLVVVEGDGEKVGLLVDDLLAQQQVVIKSLETNYQRVEGISGATILGDGSVSLILDIPGLIRRASRRANGKKRNKAA